jgi:MarR family transcriptional regulator for hemolysin
MNDLLAYGLALEGIGITPSRESRSDAHSLGGGIPHNNVIQVGTRRMPVESGVWRVTAIAPCARAAVIPCTLQIAELITRVMLSSTMKTHRSLDNDFLFLIYDIAQSVRRHADTSARTRGMTRAQWAVLARLERQPNITQNELAQLTDVEPITVGRLIDRLEKAGFVQRMSDPRDRRIWRLRLTLKSRPVLSEIAAFRAELHDAMSADVDAQTLASLIRGLKKMKANLATAKVGGRKGNAS